MATLAMERSVDPELAEGNPPVEEQIALLAYRLWNERGCPEGSPEVDWFHAEQELKMAVKS